MGGTLLFGKASFFIVSVRVQAPRDRGDLFLDGGIMR